MPPKETKLDEIPATQVLPLQDWLKLLSSRGVDMRVAMTLAAKMYNSHNTKERLETLDAKKLTSVITDKEARRTVVNAVKGISSGKSHTKKRTRDSDLLEPLQETKDDLPESLDFHPIVDPEQLIPITVTTNRAPVKTAWAYTVAMKMGFDIQESLSIAHVYVHLSSLKHALRLGNILNKEETKEAEEELAELPGEENGWLARRKEREQGGKGKGKGRSGWGREKDRAEEDAVIGSSQPWVGILRARPVIERPDGTWRAIQKGIPVQPSVAYLYITRAFKTYTPHIMGSLKLLADSYPADELNRLGMHMYNAFKPETEQWGQKATLECVKILDQLKTPLIPSEAEQMAKKEGESVSNSDMKPNDIDGDVKKPIKIETSTEDAKDGNELSSVLSEPPTFDDVKREEEPPKKKRMTVEEYEAMLDAEDGEGGFLEAGDIAR